MPGLLDVNTTVYSSVADLIVNTPYLDVEVWKLITLLGLGFLILSNLTTKEQNNVLWALIAPFFLFPSAWFALQLNSPRFTAYVVDNSTVRLQTTNIIFHPEWLAFVMGVIWVLSLINLWMIFIKKPMERTTKQEFMGREGI